MIRGIGDPHFRFPRDSIHVFFEFSCIRESSHIHDSVRTILGEFLQFHNTLGGECVYKISDGGINGIDNNFKTTPYWNWRASLTPGIALRLFGNTSIYIAPTLEVLHFELMPGITAGINVGL